MPSVTASTNESLPFVVADFDTLVEGLDYAAKGETGCNFFSGKGDLQQTVTYRELRDTAVTLAQRLDRAGIERGTRVAIVAETTPDFLNFFFACQYAGPHPGAAAAHHPPRQP